MFLTFLSKTVFAIVAPFSNRIISFNLQKPKIKISIDRYVQHFHWGIFIKQVIRLALCKAKSLLE